MSLFSRLEELPAQLSASQSQTLLAETLAAYERHLDAVLPLYVRVLGEEMLEWRTEGAYLYSPSGKRWMDCYGAGGVFGLGFRHPRVVAAVKRQLDRVALASRHFLDPTTAALAEKLCGLAPRGLDRVWFSNSGTEALEAALKLARLATGRPGIVGTQSGYHGMSIATLSISGLDTWRRGIEPPVEGSSVIRFNDIEAVRSAVTERTAALVLEPVQWASGCEAAKPEYLRAAREHCDKVGALLILDEVQTGLGRAGALWAHQAAGIVPDLLAVGKVLTGGVMPLAALLYGERVHRVERDRYQFNNSSYGGNALACAAGLATLKILTEEGLLQRAVALGERLGESLDGLAKKYPGALKAQRGAGLMRCLEMKLPTMGLPMQDFVRKRGVIVLSMMQLDLHHLIRVSPPFTLSDAEFDFFLRALEESLREIEDLSRGELMAYSEDLGRKAREIAHGQGHPAGGLGF